MQNKIALLGDSIAAGIWGTSLGIGGRLESEHNQIVGNHSEGGAVISGAQSAYTSRVSGMGYDYVIVWVGINNIKSFGNTDVVAWGALESFIDDILSGGFNVICLTLAPFKDAADWDLTKQGYVESVNADIRAKVDASYEVIDAYDLLGDPAEPEKLLSAYANADNVHLTNAGNDVIIDAIIALLP